MKVLPTVWDWAQQRGGVGRQIADDIEKTSNITGYQGRFDTSTEYLVTIALIWTLSRQLSVSRKLLDEVKRVCSCSLRLEQKLMMGLLEAAYINLP